MHAASRRSGSRRGWHGACIAQRRIDRQRLRVLDSRSHSLVTPFVRPALVGNPDQTRSAGRRSRERVRSIKRRSMRRLCHMRGNMGLDCMVMMQGRRLWALRSPGSWRPFQPPLLGLLNHHVRLGGIGRVIQEFSDIVHKQRIQQIGDFLLVGKLQGTLKWDPNASQWKSKYKAKNKRSYQTPFKCIGPIFTTERTFSLFKIPSRRPLVIPATLSNFVPLIIWLSG